jgi:aspartate/methionine/tyrosine aminotransferase
MQMAAVEALNNPESWYDTVNETYKERRKIAISVMEILKCKFSNDQAGLFIWGRLPDEVESCEAFVEDILVKANVFVTPGFIFGSKGERYIRISLCASNERLNEARERIANHLPISNNQ